MDAAQMVRALTQASKLCGLHEEAFGLCERGTDVRLADVRDLAEQIAEAIDSQLPRTDRRPPATDEQSVCILELSKQGLPDGEVGRRLGLPPAVVRRTRREAGVAGSTWRARTGWEARIGEAHGRGLTTPQIAEATGYTVRTVQQRLAELGLKANR